MVNKADLLSEEVLFAAGYVRQWGGGGYRGGRGGRGGAGSCGGQSGFGGAKLMEEENMRIQKNRKSPMIILTNLKRGLTDLMMKGNQPHATNVDPSSTT